MTFLIRRKEEEGRRKKEEGRRKKEGFKGEGFLWLIIRTWYYIMFGRTVIIRLVVGL
ncbi:MAG: hypothetical protein F6K24_51850 [Okeania sp. SIO2D1]|nr:hypothetical protein [Okeania sp. SIO2D1]